MNFDVGDSLLIDGDYEHYTVKGIRAYVCRKGITMEASAALPVEIVEITAERISRMELKSIDPSELPTKERFQVDERVWDTVNTQLDTIRAGPFRKVKCDTQLPATCGTLYLLVKQRNEGELHLVAPKFLKPATSTTVARYARKKRRKR